MEKYLIVYASETGNTKLLAEELYNALPISGCKKKIVNVRSWNGRLDAENVFIGFWANRGSCSLEIIDIISSLHNKNVAIFGTCGLGNTDSYYKNLEQNALVWLPSDNNYMGSFFCQGKMPYQIRNKYESCRGKCEDSMIDYMLSQFDDAASHPDRQDLLKARIFAEEVQKKIKELEAAYA